MQFAEPTKTNHLSADLELIKVLKLNVALWEVQNYFEANEYFYRISFEVGCLSSDFYFTAKLAYFQWFCLIIPDESKKVYMFAKKYYMFHCVIQQ